MQLVRRTGKRHGRFRLDVRLATHQRPQPRPAGIDGDHSVTAERLDLEHPGRLPCPIRPWHDPEVLRPDPDLDGPGRRLVDRNTDGAVRRLYGVRTGRALQY